MSFSFFQTQIEKEIHEDKQNYDQENEKRKIAYLQKKKDIHCRDNKQKRDFHLHRCRWSVWNIFFYTQLDGLVGFFTSHNCEILMSHWETPAPARHILILATDIHLNEK